MMGQEEYEGGWHGFMGSYGQGGVNAEHESIVIICRIL